MKEQEERFHLSGHIMGFRPQTQKLRVTLQNSVKHSQRVNIVLRSLQITVGGYKANDASVPEDGCNAITLMCLKASRRLPLTAPCLSLRMHKNMPTEVIEPSHLHTAYFLILCSIAQSKDVYILFT